MAESYQIINTWIKNVADFGSEKTHFSAVGSSHPVGCSFKEITIQTHSDKGSKTYVVAIKTLEWFMKVKLPSGPFHAYLKKEGNVKHILFQICRDNSVVHMQLTIPEKLPKPICGEVPFSSQMCMENADFLLRQFVNTFSEVKDHIQSTQ